MLNSKTLIAAAATSVMVAGTSHGAVLASADFDGRTATGATASNLNWTVNGLDDPGSITNDTANLFNTSAVVQNNFTPGINTGNGNTSWIATLTFNVATGFTTTVEDVSFNGISINGGQALNVARKNDFTVTLLDPSLVAIDSVTIADTVADESTQPLITFDLADTVLGAGTYTLTIRGGDFTGDDETGNHTGIDNLSINGTAVPVPEPSSLALLTLGGLAMVRRRRA